MKLYYFDDITPVDYQPPGFKEGVSDRLWFEGMPVHFKVGEVSTAFHALRVRVSVEQSQVERLQKGNYVKASRQASPEGGTMEGGPKKTDADAGEGFPSEDESAQFKKSRGPPMKGGPKKPDEDLPSEDESAQFKKSRGPPMKGGPKKPDEDLPSEDESAQFKRPKRPVTKRKAALRNLSKKKRI
ncbi:HORMA domain-containing protein 1 [Austrofundulus limnaeus]|uniref:HORMA domain-containing protein 1 n=1 Tax=Austrofundulus limnaeus TaxID=52670 RepID=A0A2I4CBS6_AUSLI|nr:PREDICTED: HORMA domain-containing protein 1-like [Austrofundulus limnaeus]